jgi:hypothetical protein
MAGIYRAISTGVKIPNDTLPPQWKLAQLKAHSIRSRYMAPTRASLTSCRTDSSRWPPHLSHVIMIRQPDGRSLNWVSQNHDADIFKHSLQ